MRLPLLLYRRDRLALKKEMFRLLRLLESRRLI